MSQKKPTKETYIIAEICHMRQKRYTKETYKSKKRPSKERSGRQGGGRVIRSTSRVAACCSVLQRVAVCCSVLQLQRVVVCCSVLQCVAACCSQCVAVCFGLFEQGCRQSNPPHMSRSSVGLVYRSLLIMYVSFDTFGVPQRGSWPFPCRLEGLFRLL